MTEPHLQAAVDQADASNEHAHRLACDYLGHPIHDPTLARRSELIEKPVIGPLLSRLTGMLVTGRTVPCAHPAGVVSWAPWAPGLLRCPACLARVLAEVMGTRQDRTCDGCRRWQPPSLGPVITPATVTVPGHVMELPAGPPLVVPAIVITFATCSACTALLREATQ